MIKEPLYHNKEVLFCGNKYTALATTYHYSGKLWRYDLFRGNQDASPYAKNIEETELKPFIEVIVVPKNKFDIGEEVLFESRNFQVAYAYYEVLTGVWHYDLEKDNIEMRAATESELSKS